MRLSAPFSLALVGTMSSLTFGFSLRPHPASLPSSPHNSLVIRSPPSLFKTSSTLRIPRGGERTSRHVSTTVSDTQDGSSGKGGSSAGVVLDSIMNGVVSLWAAGGVIMILARAMKRVVPIALEPFQSSMPPLSTFQLG